MMEAINKTDLRGDTKMKNNKIIQMMTTDRKINAIFKRKGYVKPYFEEAYPVMGLVLVEDETGDREIRTIYLGPKGLIEYLEEGQEDFLEIRPHSKGLNIYQKSDRLI